MIKNDNQCLAIKKSNERCTVLKSYKIEYNKYNLYLCGTHLNVFKRNPKNLNIFKDKKVNISILPTEILEMVFKNMELDYLFDLKLVCLKWKVIIQRFIKNNILCTLILDKNINIRFSKHYNYDFFYNNDIKYIKLVNFNSYQLIKKFNIKNLEITCSYLSKEIMNIINFIYNNFNVNNIYLNFLNMNKQYFINILINILNNTKNSIEIHTYNEIDVSEIKIKNNLLKRLLIYNKYIYKNINICFPNLEYLGIIPQVIESCDLELKNIKILELFDNFEKYHVSGIRKDLFDKIIYIMTNNKIKLIKWNIISQKYLIQLSKINDIELIFISKKYEGLKYLNKYKNIKLI